MSFIELSSKKQTQGEISVKNLIKKNQLMITALAIMLAIAGYLQFAGNNLEEEEYLAVDNMADKISYTEVESLDSEVEIVLDDYLEEDMTVTGDLSVAEAQPDANEIPGEAVFTSANGVAVLSEAKLLKEQVRAKNKETLLEIINSDGLTDAQKQDAVDTMVQMTGVAEKETAVFQWEIQSK